MDTVQCNTQIWSPDQLAEIGIGGNRYESLRKIIIQFCLSSECPKQESCICTSSRDTARFTYLMIRLDYSHRSLQACSIQSATIPPQNLLRLFFRRSVYWNTVIKFLTALTPRYPIVDCCSGGGLCCISNTVPKGWLVVAEMVRELCGSWL